MKYEKQARALIRKMIRSAKQDWTTGIYVRPRGENDVMNEGQLEREIIDAVFGCDETIITFHRTLLRGNPRSLNVLLGIDQNG